ncbi:MAG: universal stress protein [Terricaulis sp.]
MSAFACLVIADESPEFPAALTYASLLAKGAGWRLVMLRVIEPSEPAPWASVSEEIRRQAQATAESLIQRFSAEVWAETGITAEAIVVEGELRPEVRKVIEGDATITLVVLAAAHGAGGPGPLVASLAKGQGFGGRAVPVLVVPGALTKDEVRALGLPAPPQPAEPSA